MSHLNPLNISVHLKKKRVYIDCDYEIVFNLQNCSVAVFNNKIWGL